MGKAGERFADFPISIPPYLTALCDPLPRQQEWVSSQRWLCTKNVRNFLRAGGKGCTKMKSQSMNLMGIEFVWLSMLWLVCRFGTKTSHKLFILNLSQHYSDECILSTLTPASAWWKKQMPTVVIVVLQVGLVPLHLKGPWTPYSLQELSFPKCW